MKIRLISLILGICSVAFAQKAPQLSLNKIFEDYQFYPKSAGEMIAMADGEHYSMLESDLSIAAFDYKTGEKASVIMPASVLPDTILSVHDYAFSADESKILLTTYVRRIYRHSTEASYWIYDVKKNQVKALDKGKQQLATFSPDGKKVAFVKDNNLYYKDLETDSLFQITFDGAINRIINGAPDWVYEEEFGFARAFNWSNDSRSIGFYRFDESEVKQFDMIVYHDLYPSVNRFKYPKAGECNSIVSVHVYHLETRQIVNMNAGEETDQYIVRIKWSSLPGKLAIIRLNRLQNKVDILLADENTGESRIIYHEENARYLSRIGDDYVHFLADRKHFIIMSERSGYYHYYLHSMDGKLINPVTKGNWEVIELLGIDEKSKTVYYTSNQSNVLNKDVYSVHFDGTGEHRLTSQDGHNSAAFSTRFKYFINTWSDANTPPQTTVHRINGTKIRVIEDNAELNRDLKDYGFAKKEFIKIPVSGGIELNAYIIKPADFDSARNYPLLISVYGGPQSQDVTNSWDVGIAWQQLIAGKGIIVACIDNRGTDGRGEEFRKCTYLQLGKLETEDQINAATYLGKKSWIDEKRMGIWGWSYGGYMTLLCMTKGADVFKAGIAVAPVTNWRYYDNIYTERFMRTPQVNPKGYDDNSPINHANELKGKLLLIHGMADDNVHLQNSAAMAERLVMENKQFQQFMYPNKNHNINGGNTRLHLYTMMTQFLMDNL